MGVFSFMETFFFISLGITFVMIIMLVYHFKQRIIVLERKHDTMFDIVNNIVKQIKNMQVSITYLGENQHATFHPSKHENVVTFSNGLLPTNMHEFNIMFNEGSKSEPRENTPEDSDEDDDSEGEDDEDDDDSEDEDDDDSEDEEDDENSEEDDASEENKKIIVSDDDNQVESNIKVINVDINENDTTESNDLGIVEISEMSEIESTLLKQNMELNDEDIVIRKIENTKTEEVTNESIKDNKEIYKKMSLSVLRATVIEKGLSTDPSKLKKQELVQLLESAE